MSNMDDFPKLLTSAEVARRFGVSIKTVTHWAKKGQLPSMRTLGGHRRFDAAVIDRLKADTEEPATTPIRRDQIGRGRNRR